MPSSDAMQCSRLLLIPGVRLELLGAETGTTYLHLAIAGAPDIGLGTRARPTSEVSHVQVIFCPDAKATFAAWVVTEVHCCVDLNDTGHLY